MAEELQALLDRIQKDAVDAGERRAAEIAARAEEQAAARIREAEQKAKELLTRAERDAGLFAERGRQTLQQAARDLLIGVGAGLERILGRLAAGAAEQALTPEALRPMLLKLAEAYAARGGAESRIEVLLGEQDRERLAALLLGELGRTIKGGVEIRVDPDLRRGFRAAFADGRITHDFSAEAIAEALSDFLRPRLAAILREAARAPAQAGGAGP